MLISGDIHLAIGKLTHFCGYSASDSEDKVFQLVRLDNLLKVADGGRFQETASSQCTLCYLKRKIEGIISL